MQFTELNIKFAKQIRQSPVFNILNTGARMNLINIVVILFSRVEWYRSLAESLTCGTCTYGRYFLILCSSLGHYRMLRYCLMPVRFAIIISSSRFQTTKFVHILVPPFKNRFHTVLRWNGRFIIVLQFNVASECISWIPLLSRLRNHQRGFLKILPCSGFLNFKQSCIWEINSWIITLKLYCRQ